MPAWCLLILLATCCLQWAHASSFNVAKMLLPHAGFNPLVTNTLVQARIDQVLSKVQNQTCVEHMKVLLDGVKHKQFWALNMMDASARVDGVLAFLRLHLGNYEQCLRVQDVHTTTGDFSGKYCLARICLSSVPVCIDRPTRVFRMLQPILKEFENPNTQLQEIFPRAKEALASIEERVAVCLPSTCSSQDVEAMIQAAVSQVTDQIRVNVDPKECYTTEGPEFSVLDNFTIAFFSLVLAVITWSTVYDLTHQQAENRNEKLIALSAYRNLRKMLRTTDSGDQDLSLQCLHGLRFISMLFVILGHTYLERAGLPLFNVEGARKFIQSWPGLWVMATPFTVDTFFVLSGLLLAYIFLNVTSETNKMNFVAFYLHRIIRLTPALAAVVLLDSSLAKKVGTGPIWRSTYKNDCATTWWEILLYIKNYRPGSTCMTHTWYVSVDTQLYFLSPLLLIPLWRNPRRGELLLGVAFFFSWLIPFLKAYIWNIDVPVTARAIDEPAISNLYKGTENRYGPWIIGIWMGYILHQLKTGKLIIGMSKRKAIASWLYVGVVLMGCIISLHPHLQLGRQALRFNDSLYNSVIRLLWGSGVALLIFNCVTGYGGGVNWFLSLKCWVPWSRITYSMYLIHLVVLFMVSSRLRTPQFFSNFAFVHTFISVVVLTVLAAIILSLIFEVPLINLEKLILKSAKKNATPRSVKDSRPRLEKRLVNGDLANSYMPLKSEEDREV